jgi:hypothetical protein
LSQYMIVVSNDIYYAISLRGMTIEVLANDHTLGAISENLWWVGYWTW